MQLELTQHIYCKLQDPKALLNTLGKSKAWILNIYFLLQSHDVVPKSLKLHPNMTKKGSKECRTCS